MATTRSLPMLTSAALLACGAMAAHAAVIDCGAPGKAKIFDRLHAVGKARIQYRAGTTPCIAKGPGGDPAQLSGTYQILYVDNPGSAQGAFVLPSPWQLNEENKARYLNTQAPVGGDARKVGIRPAKNAKFGSKGLGDGTDMDVSSPPGTGGILSILTVDNAIDGNTYRVCTRWSLADGSGIRYDVIDGGFGRRIILSHGVPASCNVVPTTTTTSTSVTTTTSTSLTTTTSTSTTTTTSTSTTTLPPTGTVLRFTTGTPVGICGVAKAGGAGGTVVKNLSCGGLNLGHGSGTVPEGPTPSGADTLFNTACVSGSCTVSARTAAQTGSNRNCSDTGCDFGPFLPIPNPGTPALSTCVHNTFDTPGSGTLNSSTGSFDGAIPLSSQTTVTGNLASPCPKCLGGTPGVAGSGNCDNAWVASGGTPSPDSGAACTPTNTGGDTYDCRPPQAPYSGVLAPFPVTLSPIGTGQTTKSGLTPCPGQTTNGCFGQPTCDYIEENGAAAGPLSPGAHAGTLASVFCIPATGNVLVDGSAGLPGPGATSLPGTLTLLP